jgi:transketolase
VLVGTGSELHLALAAQAALEQAGYAARVVSMPSRELFMQQDEPSRRALLPTAAKKVVVEAGTRFGWGDVVGAEALFVTQDGYGHSAPAKVLAEELGFTPEKVAARVLAWVKGGGRSWV